MKNLGPSFVPEHDDLLRFLWSMTPGYCSDSVRSGGGVQREETPLEGGLGAMPQFPKGGWVGIKDICLIETMLVEKTSASLNSYDSGAELTKPAHWPYPTSRRLSRPETRP